MKKPIFVTLLLTVLAGTCLASTITASLDLSPWLDKAPDKDGIRNYLYDRHQVVIDNVFNSFEIRYDGEIHVSDDDRSIRSISPNGYLRISYRTFGNKRELLVSSDRSGRLSYEFYEGRKEVPFEPEGKKWLADVLLDVVRSTGIDADGRTARIYAGQGMDAFIEEVSKISSNGVQSKYFEALLSGHELSQRELVATADAISRTMNSSSSRGRLLTDHADKFLQDSQVAAAYFMAVSRIPSSSEKGRVYRNIDWPLDFNDPAMVRAYFAGIDKISSDTESGSVLRHTIANQSLPKEAQIALLVSVARLNSNTEAARVLRSLGSLDMEDTEIIEAYFLAVDHLSSNTEAGSVLRDLLIKNKVEGQAMVAFLNSCQKMSSNSEIGSVLRSLKDLSLGEARIREAYFSVIRSLSSDSEAGRTLRHSLGAHEFNRPALISFYETTRTLSSNSEIGSVLLESLALLPYEKPVLDAFFTTVNSLSSSSEHGRVLRQLAGKGDLSDDAFEGILHSARRISSNSEKGYVLRTLAPMIPDDNSQLKELYIETARSLSSDNEFRRAMEAIM